MPRRGVTVRLIDIRLPGAAVVLLIDAVIVRCGVDASMPPPPTAAPSVLRMVAAV